jgi:hypothetical protein
VLPDASYAGCKDATLVSYEPDYPHTASQMYLRNDASSQKNGLQRWDLNGYMPAWSIVTLAQLNVYVYNSSNVNDVTVSLYPVIRTWIADQATWNSATDDVRWGTAGALNTVSDIVGVPVDDATLTDAGRWYAFDVTSLVQQWVADPATNKGVLYRITWGQGSVEYELASCRFAYGDPTRRPQLVVAYNNFYNGNTPTATATATATQTPVVPWTPTNTKTPRPTFTYTRTPSHTPTRTFTATNTPTATHTATAVSTATPTATVTDTGTATRTPKPSFTPTETASATGTPTESPTITPTPTPCADIYEPNDSSVMAAAIVPNTPPQLHNFHVAGDVDWQVFAGMAGNSYVLRTLNLAGVADTLLCLYDGATMAQIVCDDDGGAEPLASQITHSFAGAGIYYVAVSHRDPAAAGCSMTYELEVSFAAFTPTATATLTPTVTATPTATSTPRVYSIHLPVILADEAPGG